MSGWTARTVRVWYGPVVVCGRKVGGRYVCQGRFGLVVRDPYDPDNVGFRMPGWTEDPKGSRQMRRTARSLALQRLGRVYGGARTDGRPFVLALSAPLDAVCDDCGMLNHLTQELLDRG